MTGGGPDRRQIHLFAFLKPPGEYLAAWRHPDANPGAGTDFAQVASLARTAEAALFDAVFFADLVGVTVADLAKEPLLLAEEAMAPEFNQFTVEMCRAAGFTPTVYRGTVESIRAAADLVAAGRCLYCVPSSCIAALPGTIWRPLTEPASDYPWSVLWRAADDSGHVRAVVSCAQAMSKRLGWLTAAGERAGAP